VGSCSVGISSAVSLLCSSSLGEHEDRRVHSELLHSTTGLKGRLTMCCLLTRFRGLSCFTITRG